VSDPVHTGVMTVWRSPANRLHKHRRCSGNGRPRDTRRVKVTEDQFNEMRVDGRVCRCVFGGFKEDQ
jgi:hypothetical protein